MIAVISPNARRTPPSDFMFFNFLFHPARNGGFFYPGKTA
jgi:hypothetical protein